MRGDRCELYTVMIVERERGTDRDGETEEGRDGAMHSKGTADEVRTYINASTFKQHKGGPNTNKYTKECRK